MSSGKVLIVGMGFFGRLLIDDLLNYSSCDLGVASRHPFKSKRFETVVADLRDPASLNRSLQGVAVAICAAGPYQEMPLSFAEVCLQRGVLGTAGTHAGFAVGGLGFALSAAALLGSVAGMFWTNVLLVPTLLLYGLEESPGRQRRNRNHCEFASFCRTH
jgi:hypothetical protein